MWRLWICLTLAACGAARDAVAVPPRPTVGLRSVAFVAEPPRHGWGGFAEGDAIEVTSVEGDRPTCAEGGTYVVHVRYTLSSRARAHVQVFQTGLDAKSESEGVDVVRGSGELNLPLKIIATGRPHASFYPLDHGEQFGGVYFRCDR